MDLEIALGLLQRTASGAARSNDNSVPLAALGAYYASERGHRELFALARRLDVDANTLPRRDETRRLFDDELLSAKALRLHRGRNVYSGGKIDLWQRWWLPFRDTLTPGARVVECVRELVALRTHKDGEDVDECVALLQSRLFSLGFDVSVHADPGHAPLLMARRPARGLPGQIVFYGHYDAVVANPEDWSTDPWQLSERDGRLYGVGVGDNKAALAHRLLLLEEAEETPEIVWVIQGEEEIGSPLAHAILPELLSEFRPTAWVEENGYFEDDGTQRLLAHRVGTEADFPMPPDAALWRLIEAFGRAAGQFGLRHRIECRNLNKFFFPEGCPWGRSIPFGDRYIAFGLNDPASGIHQANESVPMWTFAVHAAQFTALMQWAGEEAV